MMDWTLADVAEAVGGRLPADVSAAQVCGVEFDSRRLPAQGLFVALRGENGDGHSYLRDADGAGALAAIVERETDARLPHIVVPSTAQAFTRLASHWRGRYRGRIAAITGSNGKTTVKEMLHCIMVAAVGEERALCSRGNYNNHFGVPYTLLQLRDEHEYAAIEAGMDHAGELTALSALIQPHVALINNAQRAHIGHFDSVRAIACAKGELLSGLAADGVAVLNADDAHYPLWREMAGGREVLSFGVAAAADVRGVFTPAGLTIDGTAVALAVPGAHNKMNALAAAAAARALRLPAKAIVAGLEAYRGTGGRLFSIALADGGVLIDDTYNANPDSAAAAVCVLHELAAARGARALMIMGDMLALGDSAAAAHAALVEECAARGVRLFGVGELMGAALADGGGEHFTDRDALVARAAAFAGEGVCCVLVKGSRGMRMEGVVQGLREVLPLADGGGGEAG